MVCNSRGLFAAHDLHLVQVSLADKVVFASFRVLESLGVRASSMGDQRTNFASLVWVSFLKHSNAHKLVRWEVLVKPLQGLVSQSLPVCISTTHEVRMSLRVAHLIGVPDCLASGASNVLGSS